MKVGDLVRIRAAYTWKYQYKWCKEQQVKIVSRRSGSCIAFADDPQCFRPKGFFMVVSRND
jgi:hypothetical protein